MEGLSKCGQAACLGSHLPIFKTFRQGSLESRSEQSGGQSRGLGAIGPFTLYRQGHWCLKAGGNGRCPSLRVKAPQPIS